MSFWDTLIKLPKTVPGNSVESYWFDMLGRIQTYWSCFVFCGRGSLLPITVGASTTIKQCMCIWSMFTQNDQYIEKDHVWEMDPILHISALQRHHSILFGSWMNLQVCELGTTLSHCCGEHQRYLVQFDIGIVGIRPWITKDYMRCHIFRVFIQVHE